MIRIFCDGCGNEEFSQANLKTVIIEDSSKWQVCKSCLVKITAMVSAGRQGARDTK